MASVTAGHHAVELDEADAESVRHAFAGSDLAGYRALLVELPGRGLSGPVAYRPGAVRDHTVRLLDDLFEALELSAAPVVGHSLGGMFALWYAAARPGR